MFQVSHSMRVNDTPLEPWLIIADDGVVQSAHCTCMAGLSEGCSHIAAVLFAIGAWHAHHEGGISDGRASVLALPNCCKVPISVPSNPRN